MVPVVYKTFSTCTAHRLLNHPGACRNLHGHNYNITIGFTTNQLDENTGMIVDFGDLKMIAGAWIDEHFDHKTVLQHNDPLVPALKALFEYGCVMTMPCAPTAENMALMIMTDLEWYLRSHNLMPDDIKIVSVAVEETKKNVAEVRSK